MLVHDPKIGSLVNIPLGGSTRAEMRALLGLKRLSGDEQEARAMLNS